MKVMENKNGGLKVEVADKEELKTAINSLQLDLKPGVFKNAGPASTLKAHESK